MSTSITVKFPPEIFKTVEDLARDTGMTKTYIVKTCVKRELGRFVLDFSPDLFSGKKTRNGKAKT